MKINSIIAAIGLLLILITSCENGKKNTALFQSVSSQNSGLYFTNALTENDSINILDNEFVYNGSGVALGDLNNDGLDDIFLAGNQVDNKLFLNEGALKFKDISATAGIIKPDSLLWSSGVSILDINLDGKQDIYICNTFYKSPERRRTVSYTHLTLPTTDVVC